MKKTAQVEKVQNNNKKTTVWAEEKTMGLQYLR